MKKIFALAVVFSMICLSVSAESKSEPKGTRMGQKTVNVGLAGGYGTQDLAYFAHLVADFNLPVPYLRVRSTLGLMERSCSPTVSANLQYLFPVVGGLYVYPSVGAYAEYHKNKRLEQFSAGAVVGAGAEYQYSGHLGFFVEGGYQMLTPIANRAELSLGVMLHF